MLTNEDIVALLYNLNALLAERGVDGEIVLGGGAVMSVVFGSRAMTEDVDALFSPPAEVRAAASQLAEDAGLDDGWLNDGLKGFVDPSRMSTTEILSLSNLAIRRLDDESLLAMKLASARDNDGKDLADAAYLLRRLGIETLDEALDVLESHTPSSVLTYRMQAFAQAALAEAWGDGGDKKLRHSWSERNPL